MTKIYLVLLFTGFLIISCAAPLTPVTLHMENGEMKKGFANQNPYKEIKFKEARSAKAVKYDFDNITTAEYNTNQGLKRYVRLPIKDKDKKIVVEEILLGEVSLYTTNRQGYNAGMGAGFGAAGGMGMGFGGGSYNIDNFYLKKDSESALTHLGSNQLFTKNFVAAASEYFKDCPLLVGKIKEKEYRKRDLREIVIFYNEHCR